MDIRDAMMMLQGQGQGQPGMGANPQVQAILARAQASPLGALQPGVPPSPLAQAPMAGPGGVDLNGILGRVGMEGGMGMGGLPPQIAAQMEAMRAQQAARQQAHMQMLSERLGARTGGAMQFDPTMGAQGMRQQFQDWRQAGNQPVGFGAGNGGMRPPGGMGGAPGMTQPAGVATLPAGGVQSALGADQWGGGGMQKQRRPGMEPVAY